MHIYGEITSFVELAKSFWRETHSLKPKDSIEQLQVHFSKKIVMVEETMMARLKDGITPRKINQWLKNAIDLEDTLNNKGNKSDGLKNIRHKIRHNIHDCPIEDVGDEPTDFVVAPMLHEAECEDCLHAQDVEKEVASPDHQHDITVVIVNGTLVFQESNGRGASLKRTSNYRHVDDGEAESSQARDVVSKHHDQISVDHDIGFARVGEAESGMIFPIVLPDLRPSKFDLNEDLGLRPDMDNYSFSCGMIRKEEENGVIVNPSIGSMPTGEEWRRARVVNLAERKSLLLNDDAPPHCPNLLILFLQRNRRLTRIPPSFFTQMPCLQFLDLSDTRIEALPRSIFNLKNLKMLLLRSCVCLGSVPAEVGNLTNMQVLDLLGTDLPDLPKEIRGLIQLRHLQLSFYQHDKESKNELVSSGAISHLQALQGLTITVHPKDQHWTRTVQDVIKQVGELKMLRYLQFYFPSVEALVYFSKVSVSWREKRLRRFNFVVGHNIKRIISRVPEEVESKYEEYDKCLRLVSSDELPRVEMKEILKSVTAFYLDHHLEVRSFSEFDVSSFMELRFCVLRECPNMEKMIIGEERIDAIIFPNLEYLGLHYLWELKRIWENVPTLGSYQALKYLMISTCCKLKYIASHSVLQCLINLETFIVEDCELLTSIVKENEMVKHDTALLNRLKKLVLRHLPQLEALGRGLFPSENIIQVEFCPKLNLRPGHSRSSVWKTHVAISSSAPLPKLDQEKSETQQMKSSRATEEKATTNWRNNKVYSLQLSSTCDIM